MMGLLTLIFFAALVGIAKPYAGKLNRKHFAGIAAASFVGMMIVVPKDEASTASAETNANSSLTAMDAPAEPTAAATSPSEPAAKWSYSERKDEMRGTTSRYASLVSENEVDLDFPYGEQRGEITVRRNSDGLNVMFSVGKGQILCNSFTDTTLAVKFDDGPIQRMGCTDTSDGSSETVFFTNESRVLTGLKKAKRTIIEAEFYQQGRQQFVFETAGLDWK